MVRARSASRPNEPRPEPRGAFICGVYRYLLWRVWDAGRPALPLILLNPSVADGERDDATLRRCMGLARRLGRGGVLLANLFAYRATDPRRLATASDPVGPLNDRCLEALGRAGGPILAAWGNGGRLRDRAATVRRLLVGASFWCVGLTGLGQPRHVLYTPAGARLRRVPGAADGASSAARRGESPARFARRGVADEDVTEVIQRVLRACGTTEVA